MVKRHAELKNANGEIIATLNEFCRHYGTSALNVRFHGPFAPQTLKGTELLEIFVKGNSQPALSIEASDPDGTEVREFHGRSAIGRIADGAELALVKSPGGDLGTLLIVLANGTLQP